MASEPAAEAAPEPAPEVVPILAIQIEPVRIEASPAPIQAPPVRAIEPEKFADRLAALAEQLRGGHIPYPRPEGTAPRFARPPAAPLPASAPAIVPAVAKPMALLTAGPVVALLAEPAPPTMASQVPMGSALIPRPADSPSTARGQIDPEQWSGGSITRPTRPTWIPGPGMADLIDSSAMVARAAQPVPLEWKVLTVDTAPRVTLPGPTLPRELTSLQAAGLGTIMSDRLRRRSGKGFPGWVISFVVMAGLLGTGFGVVFYALPGILASPRPAAQAEPVAAEVPSPSYPLAKYVEVTGFRFLVDFNKKSEIHYLVVNHSNALLSGMTIFVTLHSANAKPGQPPLSRFSFPAPNLAPFESREMTSPIEHVTRPLDLPEWQDLRAEVEIGQ